VQIGCDRGCKSRRNAEFRAKGRGFESIPSSAESGELRSCDDASTLAGPAAGLRELFSARGFNGLRGRLNLITLVVTPVMILAGGIRPYERSLGF
jgi:hypothetical protein